MPTAAALAEPPISDTARLLIDAGLALMAETGLAGMTLRPLAERAGLTVGAVSHRFGDKDAVLAGMVAHAQALDAEWRSRWTARAGAMSGAPPAVRAAMVDLALDDLCSGNRIPALLLCELLQAPAQNAAARAQLEGWVRDLEAFWSAMAGAPGCGLALMAYATDETVYGLSLNGDASYRALRRVCVHRLVTGQEEAEAPRRAVEALFLQLVVENAPETSVVDTRMGAIRGARREAIARAAGELIVDRGVGALTHRAVASAAGVAPSSVVYHFGSSEDLALAGLEAIIAAFHTWLPAARSTPRGGAPADDDALARTRALVRATHAIAIGAVRQQKLAPHAADMRRRRGENVRVQDLPLCAPRLHAGFDRLSAQIVSIATFGARMLAMALETDERQSIEAAQRSLFASW